MADEVAVAIVGVGDGDTVGILRTDKTVRAVVIEAVGVLRVVDRFINASARCEEGIARIKLVGVREVVLVNLPVGDSGGANSLLKNSSF